MTDRTFTPSQYSARRRSLLIAAGATLAAPLAAHAQAGGEDIVIGGSIPMTGVFAFAGIGIDAGMKDYVKMVNDAGGIKGRKIRYVPEDTGYKVDVSVAAFKKITSQNKVNLYYGDSTGFSKTINPELDRNGNILMAGASFATELNDPKKYPNQFQVYSPYTYDATFVLVDAMKRANSSDPKVYTPELIKTSFKGVTTTIEFLPNGELKNPAITLYNYKEGKKVALE